MLLLFLFSCMIYIVEKKLSLIVLVTFAVIKYGTKTKLGKKRVYFGLQFLRECGRTWLRTYDMAVRKQGDHISSIYWKVVRTTFFTFRSETSLETSKPALVGILTRFHLFKIP